MERFDGLLTEIAKESGSMELFLDCFMSFLLRRTDFFYEADPGDKMGFPPGAAENMMAMAFKKYQNEYYKKHPKKSADEYNQKIEQMKKQKDEEVPKSSSLKEDSKGEGSVSQSQVREIKKDIKETTQPKPKPEIGRAHV